MHRVPRKSCSGIYSEARSTLKCETDHKIDLPRSALSTTMPSIAVYWSSRSGEIEIRPVIDQARPFTHAHLPE